MSTIETRIAQELGVAPRQVMAAVALLDAGATVPFIARYRKELTDGLDDTQLRRLEERLGYLRELEARREAILSSIAEQGKLSAELEEKLRAADTKQALEDLYLPYRPKRRTKAMIAREAGLEPLADALANDPLAEPESLAATYLNPEAGFADVKAVLEGARQILAERYAEDADLLAELRALFEREAHVHSRVVEGKESEGAKFRDWFDHHEPIAAIPSHRALALLRGRNEGVLRLSVDVPHEEGSPHPALTVLARRYGLADQGRPADRWRLDTARWAWATKLSVHLELDALNRMRERAGEEAIRVFGRNLKELLLAAPAGARVTMGIDPGIRTGIKVAVVDATGRVIATDTLYPFEPRRHYEPTIAALAALIAQHGVELIAIGNGTASRETERLVAECLARHPELRAQKVVVSEAGASVYSASELAAQELPELDVSLRGAVSIARRLQDPLAELVKIDPKSIGIGQYQHDLDATQLSRTLDAVVEDCVNAVGVDLNTASPALLARVSGLNRSIAEEIVAWRQRHGGFRRREQLREVPRIGPRTFEQAAGFLRIPEGDDPLDASAVHPEAYPVVRRILQRIGKDVREVLGQRALIETLDPAEFTDERFGLPTVRDILAELVKPGRDPRPEFRTARFAEGIESLEDLRPGQWLEGVVTNVTNFGAFIDIGVHQDGLAHVSELSDRFVRDPHEVVKPGQIVRVRVLEVDLERRRIALSLKKERTEAAPTAQPRAEPAAKEARRPAKAAKPAKPGRRESPAPESALAQALARALER
ncbi:Tex family protein [Tepidiphilus thermophilus]|uniref:Transcriptional accessory protein Tex/SPT6 n=1 Tax=Tepidiphilus thermophilus TaxID=876478 RepID=A0A0K6IS49_9PROT|nr:Tex family protein [Tepidiphilus thermophilus]CUB05935.1 Transcriptional accessory protein Tex/SPT6 [Tepidiphilus thermophilus]